MSFNLKKIFEPKVSSWIGVIAMTYAITSIGVSIGLSPWFSWTHNAISDLGISNVAPIFNSGLIITGILLSVFALSFVQVERGKNLGLLGGIGLLSVSISVIGVGVFTEAFMIMHILFAISCFVSLIASSILIGFHFIVNRKTWGVGVLALSIGIFSIVPWFVIELPGIAIKEAVSAFPSIVWFLTLSIKFRRFD